jgi:hypothetical protein
LTDIVVAHTGVEKPLASVVRINIVVLFHPFA